MMGGQMAIAPILLLQLANAASAQNLDSNVLDSSPGIDQGNRVAQTSIAPVQITGVSLTERETGLDIQIETTGGDLPPPTSTISGDALVLELADTVLMLPDGDEFLAFEPAEGIALVQVTELPGDQIQIVVTGAEAPPAVDISSSTAGLTLSVAPGIAQTTGADNGAIQVVVTGEEDDYVVPNATTATRTDTPLRDTPQSIQVIPQQVWEDQGAVRLGDAIRNVSGAQTTTVEARGEVFLTARL